MKLMLIVDGEVQYFEIENFEISYNKYDNCDASILITTSVQQAAEISRPSPKGIALERLEDRLPFTSVISAEELENRRKNKNIKLYLPSAVDRSTLPVEIVATTFRAFKQAGSIQAALSELFDSEASLVKKYKVFSREEICAIFNKEDKTLFKLQESFFIGDLETVEETS